MLNRASYMRRVVRTPSVDDNTVTLTDVSVLPTETKDMRAILLSDIPAGNDVFVQVFGEVDLGLPTLEIAEDIIVPSTGTSSYIVPTIPNGNYVTVQVFGGIDLDLAANIELKTDVLMGPTQNISMLSLIAGAPAGNNVSTQVFGTVDLDVVS